MSDQETPEFNYAMVGQEANSWLATLRTLEYDELVMREMGFRDHAQSRGAGMTGTARVIASLIQREIDRRDGK